jgi:mannose-6-phosphate isomerase
MVDMTDEGPGPRLHDLHGQLLGWLTGIAAPRWSGAGVDTRNGGFEESLDLQGQPLRRSRRARVQGRQVYSFSVAARLGWQGDAGTIVRRGLGWFLAHFRRGDGLFRTLVSPDGEPLDETAYLYDQAFVLLALASAARELDTPAEFEAQARTLRLALSRTLAGASGGFLSTAGNGAVRESNPHMHLLEACLAWAATGTDAEWQAWADELIALALDRLLLPGSGAIGEEYDAAWRATGDPPRQRVEPGHQFEWAWLLLRGNPPLHSRQYRAALQLIAVGEAHGIVDGFAINALRGDLTPLDSDARLWPQTERLKAAAAAGLLSGARAHWDHAAEAAQALLAYLQTRTPGLWHDLRKAGGGFADVTVPASSLYHIACAIDVLDGALRAARRRGPAAAR